MTILCPFIYKTDTFFLCRERCRAGLRHACGLHSDWVLSLR